MADKAEFQQVLTIKSWHQQKLATCDSGVNMTQQQQTALARATPAQGRL